MNTTLTALIVFGCLVGAVLLGRAVRRLLPKIIWPRTRGKDQAGHRFSVDHGSPGFGIAGELSKKRLRHETKRSDPDGRQSRVLRPGVEQLRTGSRWGSATFHQAVREAVRQMWPEKRVPRRTWLPTRKQAT